MLDFLKEIEDHFSDKKSSKELLKIGVPNSFGRLHMPALLKAYTEEINALQIRTCANSSDALIRQLIDGSVDISIICGDYPFLGEKTCLLKEELFVVTPKDMKIDELEGQPLIQSFLNPIVKLSVDQWWKNQSGICPMRRSMFRMRTLRSRWWSRGLGLPLSLAETGRSMKRRFSASRSVTAAGNRYQEMSGSCYLKNVTSPRILWIL